MQQSRTQGVKILSNEVKWVDDDCGLIEIVELKMRFLALMIQCGQGFGGELPCLPMAVWFDMRV